MIEHTYSWIVDGYLQETTDPGYRSIIDLLVARGQVRAIRQGVRYLAIEAL